MNNFCKKCGGEVVNNNCSKCGKRFLNFKDIVIIIVDILRYILAVFFLILGIAFIPKLLGFLFILLSISLFPFIYTLINKYLDFYVIQKYVFILSYIIPITLFITCLNLPSDITNNNDSKNLNSNATINDSKDLNSNTTINVGNETKNDIVKKIKDNLDEDETLTSYELIEDINKYDFVIKYNKSQLSLYVCASDANSYVNKFLGNNDINSIQFECYNSSGLINYVKYENISNSTKDSIINSTTYYDDNYNIIDTNINILKANAEIDYKNSCESYNYKDVLRNPEQYSGKNAYWFGKVVQVVEKTSYYSVLRVNVSCEKLYYSGSYLCNDTIYVNYYGNQSFIDDDMVKIWGPMAGTVTYTSVLGASITIPKVYAIYMELQ